MRHHLENSVVFPSVELLRLGGGSLSLPGDLSGSYGVVLIYRGHWCPLCNAQISSFVETFDALSDADIKIVAFSADGERETSGFVAKHRVPFAVGHSANVDFITSVIGAYESQLPSGVRFIEPTGFVLDPDGRIINAVYSSRAIGRLVPNDVLHFVAARKRMHR